ncbi:hypothetical protein R3X26_16455 [Vibrio sp. TH_r3]|uniref:hypothetical protein n=1 Tax=Vibrio sp. TH_r3 TaxID=3082084 RepID=UPI002954E00C|nr:hypothetical protein [Vibrio sp. TH_r3]MDV7106000.1 hypothetical protein [Vibrio sp. TH_r3]
MNVRNERKLILLSKIFISQFRKIRNLYYSYTFSTSKLRVGSSGVFSGTKNITFGKNVLLGNFFWLESHKDGKIYIGDDVSFSSNIHIASSVEVFISSGCLVGSDVLITDHSHSYGMKYFDILPKYRKVTSKGKTVLGSNCWICDNVKILSGVNLGSNVVVAANSVVTQSFPDNVVIGGIPARVLKENINES